MFLDPGEEYEEPILVLDSDSNAGLLNAITIQIFGPYFRDDWLAYQSSSF